MNEKTHQLAQQAKKVKMTKKAQKDKADRRRRLLKTFAIGLSVLLVLLGAVLFWGYKNRTSIFHWMRGEIVINRDKYPIVGIDVSAHNGDIDFQKVKDDGYSFVIIKTCAVNLTPQKFSILN